MNGLDIIRQNRPCLRSVWSRKRFFDKELLRKASRYLIALSINHLLERDHRRLCEQNDHVCQSIEEIIDHLSVLEDKFNTLNDMCLFLRTPSVVYLEERLIRLRYSARQHLAAMERDVQEEVEHWQYLQTVLSQPLLETGLLRSYYGGLPLAVQQSPSSELDTICEENETTLSTKRSSRSLAQINTFSILSNGMVEEDIFVNRLNKTFVKGKSTKCGALIDDENVTAVKSLNAFGGYKNRAGWNSDVVDDSIIYID